jgi:hypothetical protein
MRLWTATNHWRPAVAVCAEKNLWRRARQVEPKGRADRGGLSMRVAINGARIAGGCLAYWLERSGHDVVLIEKAPQFRTGGYAVDFWGVGYTVAERMGILPEVRAHGYTFREVRDVDKRGRKVGGFSTDFLAQSLMDRYWRHLHNARAPGRALCSTRRHYDLFLPLLRREANRPRAEQSNGAEGRSASGFRGCRLGVPADPPRDGSNNIKAPFIVCVASFWPRWSSMSLRVGPDARGDRPPGGWRLCACPERTRRDEGFDGSSPAGSRK